MAAVFHDLYRFAVSDSTTEHNRERSNKHAMTRRLARVVDLIHTVNYYSPEINRFRDDGFRGWWHAYLAYRPAPLGPVPASAVTAAFYNFAPSMVERAVPGVWAIMSPDQVLARRHDLISEAFDRIFTDGDHDDTIAEAAELAEGAVTGLDPGARVLSAALADQPWPDGPAMRLWHAATIWREYRGDSHNIALAAAELDGIECHLLMAAAGHGNQPTIAAIRGWTAEEWQAATTRLQSRGLLDTDGGYTESGAAFRAEVELATDQLSAGPLDNLGPDRADRLFSLVSILSDYLKQRGEIAGTWPPPSVQR